jgi:hypothetical protein
MTDARAKILANVSIVNAVQSRMWSVYQKGSVCNATKKRGFVGASARGAMSASMAFAMRTQTGIDACKTNA